MTTPPPPLDTPPWGFIEWAITTLSAIVLGVTGYVMKTANALHSNSVDLNHQKNVLGDVLDDVKEIKDKLSLRPTQEDIGNLISNMQTILELKFDQLNNRLSRLDERIDRILTGK